MWIRLVFSSFLRSEWSYKEIEACTLEFPQNRKFRPLGAGERKSRRFASIRLLPAIV